MNTIIECPYCRGSIPIVRKIADGHEILEDVYCPHCKRSMDIEFDDVSNLPYLLAYFAKVPVPDISDFPILLKFPFESFSEEVYMTGIRKKISEDQKRKPAYEIRYHESSIDAYINIRYQHKYVSHVKCANCGTFIQLNSSLEAKEVHGLFCDLCARKLKYRFSNEYLSAFYDAEQATLKKKLLT